MKKIPLEQVINNKNGEEEKEEKKLPEKQKKIKYKKIAKITGLVISVILIVLLFSGLLSINPALSAYYNAQQGKKDLLLAQKAIEEMKMSGAVKALAAAEEDFTRSQESLSKLKWVKIIPFANIQYKASDRLLTAGIQISSTFKETLEIVEAIAAPIQFKEIKQIGGITPEQKEEILKNLYQSTPALESAQSKLELAEIEIEKMPSFGVIEDIEEAKNQVSIYLPQAKQFLEKAIVLSRLLPRFGGYPEEQSYMLLFQNNTELRPSGGFLGSFGILNIKSGEIADLKTNDTYNIDNPAETNLEPPWQLPKLVHPALDTWYLRDANWSPDFPTSAKNVEWIYHHEGGEGEFDGIIAITSTFLEYLLEVTGPVSVAGFPKKFNSENVTELIQYHVGKRFAELGLEEEFRKDLLGELATEIVGKLYGLPQEKMMPLLQTLSNSLSEKHFLLYSHDKETQKFIEEENWGGKIEETSSEEDYFISVDANMASLKTDAYIKREINYNIDLNNEEKAKVKVVLTHINNAPGFSWKTTRYRTWNRIYVPQGSELITIDGNERGSQYYKEAGMTYEIIDELDKTSIGTFTSIEPGEERELTYEYYLPEKLSKNLKKNGYKLKIQKQPGTISPDLTININTFNTIKSFSPADFGTLLENNKKVEYKTNLLTDLEFTVNY